MNEREREIGAFLTRAGWNGAEATPLKGDASRRRYIRLRSGDDSAILMDAPPGTGERVGPFLAIGAWLCAQGFSAPRILASDPAAGLVLMEDLGDDLFATVLREHPEREVELYATAGALLAEMQASPAPEGLEPYFGTAMTSALAPLFEYVLDWVDGQDRNRLRQAIAHSLETHAPSTPVVVHRDYHAENILWLPERSALARIGILDFQDAQLGYPAYDLVSLVEDARRDVSDAAREAAIGAYIAVSGRNRDEIEAEMALCGMQRNLRIVGTFARLAATQGKRHYLDMIPRVLAHLDRDLAHPVTHELARALGSMLRDAPLIRGTAA